MRLAVQALELASATTTMHSEGISMAGSVGQQAASVVHEGAAEPLPPTVAVPVDAPVPVPVPIPPHVPPIWSAVSA
jgi:hypothetical protein